MKDGLVTRQSVNSFDELYELGPARRHKCENGTRIYILDGLLQKLKKK